MKKMIKISVISFYTHAIMYHSEFKYWSNSINQHQTKVIILIGLAGSGKTNYLNMMNPDLYIIYDNYFTNTLSDDFKLRRDLENSDGKTVVISDSELCRYNIFTELINTVILFTPINNIFIIYFENDRDACMKNTNTIIDTVTSNIYQDTLDMIENKNKFKMIKLAVYTKPNSTNIYKNIKQTPEYVKWNELLRKSIIALSHISHK